MHSGKSKGSAYSKPSRGKDSKKYGGHGRSSGKHMRVGDMGRLHGYKTPNDSGKGR